MAMVRALRRLLGILAIAAGFAGLLLQLTVRDSSPEAALGFYALPLPVTGGLLVLGALLSRRRRWRKFLLVAGGLVLSGWVVRSYGWAYPVTAQWKAMTWNLGRPQHPFPPLIALVKAEQPDVAVLIESGAIPPGAIPFYERSLPGYRLVVEGKGLACLVRGEPVDTSLHGLANGSDVARFRVRLSGKTWDIYAADLTASLLLPRAPQIVQLAQLARGEGRTLVMGDFNTPLESVHLAPMRASFTEARQGPFRGFRETWFYNLPLLSLDQVWCSRDLQPVFAARRLGFASDHAPVIATFDPQ